MQKKILISLTLVLSASGLVLAETRLVPSDYPTIQDAIHSCLDGDTIIVAPGTYTGPGNRDIDFLGKAITVRSTDPTDPDIVAATIIDCNGSESEPHRGFYFQSAEDANSILDGFTVANGYSKYGGAIYCYRARPTLTNCIISGNSVKGFKRGGGGIYCYESHPRITNCTISRNSVDGSRSTGGGIGCNGGKPTIINCTISGNSVNGEWGASGGGISCLRNSPEIINCDIRANAASWQGGGIYCGNSNPKISNCNIIANVGRWNGGGIFCERSSPKISNSNIIDNLSAYGSGFYFGNSSPKISNCIVWGNRIIVGPYVSITVTYSDIQGGYPGEGNVNANPRLAPDGYHLQPNSPCINAGVPNYTPVPNETDIDGQPRVIGGRIDMGTYEFNYIAAEMKFTPQALNPCSNGRLVKAHFVLPEGFTIEDVDANTPATVGPFGIESEYMNVFINEDGLVEVEIAFDRAAFCGAATDHGFTEVTVIGLLTSGQYFGARDTIKIINKGVNCLAVLASHWLETDCGQPDWCDGVDINQDSIVNFTDLAFCDGCCLEVTGK